MQREVIAEAQKARRVVLGRLLCGIEGLELFARIEVIEPALNELERDALMRRAEGDDLVDVLRRFAPSLRIFAVM